ncbi:PREDICTED: uncharacterized protein LOC104604967 isoform X2 [Nelumbo nucifera]|uniref:Uncharacterized protein LOC104604967 isoform X2 n=1 Tax=Nelumbo nucifera TaxID=4432 RepID=A0A1U8AKM2_NELNU|nr:PREDICTED: uncharacterized protein LOC104604967 isoform X2 [Nelumbo nucifera]
MAPAGDYSTRKATISTSDHFFNCTTSGNIFPFGQNCWGNKPLFRYALDSSQVNPHLKLKINEVLDGNGCQTLHRGMAFSGLESKNIFLCPEIVEREYSTRGFIGNQWFLRSDLIGVSVGPPQMLRALPQPLSSLSSISILLVQSAKVSELLYEKKIYMEN